jgi:hypothetical protein
MNELVWHYTTCVHLSEIVESRELRCSNAGATNLAPLLWFSSNQSWEPTARKMVAAPNGHGLRPLSFHEQAKEFGCVRFGLSVSDPRLMDWKAACSFDGTPREMRRKMELTGKRTGADPKDWFAVAVSVPLEELSFQFWAPRTKAWGDGVTPQEISGLWASANGAIA